MVGNVLEWKKRRGLKVAISRFLLDGASLFLYLWLMFPT